jgi:RNA polymerase sigma-70 factor (ECF subfamily)
MELYMYQKSLQLNSEDIFTEKYKKYADMLFKLAMTYFYNRHDAEDILQETFIKLIYKAPGFIDSEHEKRWLIRITINGCKDRLKNYYSKNTVPIEETELSTDDETDNEDKYLYESIKKLPSKIHIVIYLFYYAGYDVNEISKILKIGKSAVKMRLKRGREMLKLEMESDIL